MQPAILLGTRETCLRESALGKQVPVRPDACANNSHALAQRFVALPPDVPVPTAVPLPAMRYGRMRIPPLTVLMVMRDEPSP